MKEVCICPQPKTLKFRLTSDLMLTTVLSMVYCTCACSAHVQEQIVRTSSFNWANYSRSFIFGDEIFVLLISSSIQVPPLIVCDHMQQRLHPFIRKVSYCLSKPFFGLEYSKTRSMRYFFSKRLVKRTQAL